MLTFALKNLWTNKMRSLLALVGLTVAIIGVVALIASSYGLRGDIQMGLNKLQGITVMRKGSVDPTLSRFDLTLKGKKLISLIEKIPGVKAAIAEQWIIEPRIQREISLHNSILTMTGVLGIDCHRIDRYSQKGVYGRSLKKGRYFTPKDRGKFRAVISTITAKNYKLKVGDKITLGTVEYEIIGLFETGVAIMDAVVIIPQDVFKEVYGIRQGTGSSIHVELSDPRKSKEVEEAIEKLAPYLDAVNPGEWMKIASGILANLDIFLALVSLIAVVVGGIGILNTMLMSVTERVGHFGILRANGWSRWDVVRLIVCESSVLGILGGLLGCALGFGLAKFIENFIPFALLVPPRLLLFSFGLSIFLGILGGVYPAYKAAKMNPMAAIRAY